MTSNTAYYGWGLPIDISTHGAAIDRLIFVLHYFMIPLFFGWLIYVFIALFRFRARPGHQASYKPRHTKFSSYLEIFIALFEAVLLVGFSFPVFHRYKNVPPPIEQALQVRVVAEQFAWNFHYPGEDGIFGKTDVHLISPANPVGLDPEDPAGKDDIVTVNQLHVPVNKPVITRLSSKDVIHSFTIPVMRVKTDVIPGQVIPTWFEAKETGQFEIACAQLCGLGHYRMRGFFTVETEEGFEKWLHEMRPPEPATEVAAVPPEGATP